MPSRELAHRRITLTDVAEHAGISRSTASLVVRGSPLVAGETRERVLASMLALGYVYHRGAAGLRARQSRAVGLIVTDITNAFFADLTMGCEEELSASGRAVLLGTSTDLLDKQFQLLRVMHEYNVDGVLLCPAQDTDSSVMLALQQWRLPHVLIVRYVDGVTVPYVGVDNRQAADLAATHLIEHGHRRLAFVGGPLSSSARRDRIAGCQSALARHQIQALPELFVPTAPTRQAGYAAARTLLALPNPPTALLCYSDVVALGAMLGVRACGRQPGVDVAVVGFDDIDEAAIAAPGLTTVALGPRAIGAGAARLLLGMLEQPDVQPTTVVMTPRLVVRQSCGPHDV